MKNQQKGLDCDNGALGEVSIGWGWRRRLTRGHRSPPLFELHCTDLLRSLVWFWFSSQRATMHCERTQAPNCPLTALPRFVDYDVSPSLLATSAAEALNSNRHFDIKIPDPKRVLMDSVQLLAIPFTLHHLH